MIFVKLINKVSKHIVWYFPALVIFILVQTNDLMCKNKSHMVPAVWDNPFHISLRSIVSAAIPLRCDQGREQDLELSMSLQAVQLGSRINVMKIPLLRSITPIVSTIYSYIYGPVQDCRNSRSLAMELLQTCTKLLVYATFIFQSANITSLTFILLVYHSYICVNIVCELLCIHMT